MSSDPERVSKSKSPPVGVVGGGQLAQMLVEAAHKRNLDVAVQTSSENDPAARRSPLLVLANSDDEQGTRKLLNSCSCVTFENEWINIESLIALEDTGGSFIPPLSAMAPLVDKMSQRQLLKEIGFPGPDCLSLASPQIALSKLPNGWQFPLMAKACRGGYDGKGTRVINDFKDLEQLLNLVQPEHWMLEKWVKYDNELALVASRDIKGVIRTFPLVETHQSQQVCDWVLAPAPVAHDVELMAYNLASSLLTKLDYIGVLAIEFFFGPEGLQVNEVAPRTHNSAHFSIEACNSSQFDQQVCIAADLPVPWPELVVPGALMVNLLGLSTENSQSLDNRLEQLRKHDDFHIHWYGKTNVKPGRKLGHVTVLLKGTDFSTRKKEAIRALTAIRSIWPIKDTISD